MSRVWLRVSGSSGGPGRVESNGKRGEQRKACEVSSGGCAVEGGQWKVRSGGWAVEGLRRDALTPRERATRALTSAAGDGAEGSVIVRIRDESERGHQRGDVGACKDVGCRGLARDAVVSQRLVDEVADSVGTVEHSDVGERAVRLLMRLEGSDDEIVLARLIAALAELDGRALLVARPDLRHRMEAQR